jgi:hypothetical protein
MGEDTYTPTFPAYSHMRLYRNQLSPDWQRVHDDMVGRGFLAAAHHMAQIVRYSSPAKYWASVNRAKKA